MRFVITLLLCLSTAPAIAAEDPTAAKAKAFYQTGMKHYQVGEYQAALEAFKAGYFAKPNSAFLFNMGQCHRQLGDLDDEIRQYRAYLRESPNAPNRADVEQFIAAAETEQATRAATLKPESPPPDKPAAPPPVKPAPPRHWWIGALAGGVVVVGGAIAIGLYASQPTNAPTHGGLDTATIPF